MIDFVEKKRPDYAYVASLLGASEAVNWWSNFGPVSFQLEEELAKVMGLRGGLRAVCCASGTQALHALVNLQNILAGRSLKWAVSSFGFPCTVMGPLSGAVVIDCNDQGMLDLDGVPGSVEGMVVTNVFGLQKCLEKYRNYCTKRDIRLVVDAATALTTHHGGNEAVSLHHTKAWGFGEGGVAVVEPENERLLRSILNFGRVNVGVDVRRHSLNGKLSDPASAFILDRLRCLEAVAETNRAQYTRVVDLGSEYGFKPFGKEAEHPGVPCNVPLLSPVPLADVRNSFVALQKYYKPLANTPRASSIYARVVNFPCHRELEQVPDAYLRKCFQHLRGAWKE